MKKFNYERGFKRLFYVLAIVYWLGLIIALPGMISEMPEEPIQEVFKEDIPSIDTIEKSITSIEEPQA